MPINLEDHIIVHAGMKLVPLSIVNQYIEQYNNEQLETAVKDLAVSFDELQQILKQDDKDSTRSTEVGI